MANLNNQRRKGTILWPAELATVQSLIAESLAAHCKSDTGPNAGLGPDERACGQFYGPGLENYSQRGLHGTAAALDVLLDTQEKDLCAKLIRFAFRQELANNVPSSASTIAESATAGLSLSLIRDGDLPEAMPERIDPPAADSSLDNSNNIIKLAEFVAALDRRLSQSPETRGFERLADEFRQKLLSECKAGRWSAFLDGENHQPDLVATCLALRAVAQERDEDRIVVGDAIEYLKEQFDKATDDLGLGIVAGLAQRCLILYTLKTLPPRYLTKAKSEAWLSDRIKELWRKNRYSLQPPDETTLVYLNNANNHYIQLPWQIYLCATAVIDDPARFYSHAAQRFFRTVYKDVTERHGFRYPSSSANFLSSRTNAILYRSLKLVGERDPKWRAWFSLQRFWATVIQNHPILIATAVAAWVGSTTLLWSLIQSSAREGVIVNLACGVLLQGLFGLFAVLSATSVKRRT